MNPRRRRINRKDRKLKRWVPRFERVFELSRYQWKVDNHDIVYQFVNFHRETKWKTWRPTK